MSVGQGAFLLFMNNDIFKTKKIYENIFFVLIFIFLFFTQIQYTKMHSNTTKFKDISEISVFP